MPSDIVSTRRRAGRSSAFTPGSFALPARRPFPGAALLSMDTSQIRRKLRYGNQARFTGATDFFSSEASFSPPIGDHWTADAKLGGYYIDFTLKTDEPSFPPSWFAPRER